MCRESWGSGVEAFATKENWNYTRSWLGELSPYHQTGVKAAYPISERWSAQIHLLNGWQVIEDTNRGKSVGAQVAYGSDRLSLSFNGIAGPEQQENDEGTLRPIERESLRNRRRRRRRGEPLHGRDQLLFPAGVVAVF